MVKVERNYCQCHPETCNCFKYKIVDEGGEVYMQSDDLKKLNFVADKFNKTLKYINENSPSRY